MCSLWLPQLRPITEIEIKHDFIIWMTFVELLASSYEVQQVSPFRPPAYFTVSFTIQNKAQT